MAKTILKVKTKAGIDPAVVHISGRLDETSKPAVERIASLAAQTIIIDFRGLNFISSMGIQHWIALVRSTNGKTLVLRNCPAVFINQVNQIQDMIANCVVESFETDFYCETCHMETTTTHRTDSGLAKIKADSSNIQCQNCGAQLLLEISPDQYFHFFKFIKT